MGGSFESYSTVVFSSLFGALSKLGSLGNMPNNVSNSYVKRARKAGLHVCALGRHCVLAQRPHYQVQYNYFQHDDRADPRQVAHARGSNTEHAQVQ